MEGEDHRSQTQGAAWAVAAIPYAVLLVFLTYALSARVVLGYWPIVYRDNVPPSLRSIDRVASISLLVWFWSAVVGLIPAVLLLFRSFRLRYWKPVSTFWFGVVLFYAIAWIDPWGFIDWFLD